MFLFFPVRTDAPVYHYPIATIALIVVNCVTFLLTGGFGSGERLQEMWELYALPIGELYSPLHWVTCHFLHADFLHLLGNMIFLWSFGLVIEGKVGSLQFLGISAVIGLLGAILIQTILLILPTPGLLAGYSVIASGLMPIAIWWAPKNELGLAYFFWFGFVVRAGIYDISILVFASLMIVFDVAQMFLIGSLLGTGFVVTPLAHTAGILFGVGIGWWYLKKGWVDCEGWDLLSVMRHEHYGPDRKSEIRYGQTDGTMGPSTETRRRLERAVQEKRRGGRKKKPLTPLQPLDNGEPQSSEPPEEKPKPLTIAQLVRAKRYPAAFAKWQKKRRRNPDYSIPSATMLRLAIGLDRLSHHEDAAGLFERYLTVKPDDAKIRLHLARSLATKQTRPRAALGHLDQIAPANLSASEVHVMDQLRAYCEHQIDEGVIELRGRSW